MLEQWPAKQATLMLIDAKSDLFRPNRLGEVFRDRCVGLADGTSFITGIRQNRIGDLGPHALTFRAIGFLGVTLGVFGTPRHRLALSAA
jgi:hypothetical protein